MVYQYVGNLGENTAFATGGDIAVKYYSTSKTGDITSAFKDFFFSDSDTKVEYESSAIYDDNGNLNPNYTIIGGTTIQGIQGGNIKDYYFSSIGGMVTATTAVDNWVFDETRVDGDIIDSPILLGSECYAVVVYVGEGDYVWRIEAKNDLAEQRVEEAIHELRAAAGVSFNAHIMDIAEAPASSSNALDFLPF